MVKMQNELDPYRIIILATSDHPNSNYHPKLVLEFQRVRTVKPSDITIFPNLLQAGKTNTFVLQSSMDQTNELSYVLFDTFGKTITSGEIHENNQAVTLNKLTPAIYFLRVYDKAGNSSVKKIIVR